MTEPQTPPSPGSPEVPSAEPRLAGDASLAPPSAPSDEWPLRDLEVHIVIGEDGEVIFTDLPAELVDVALALDPDSELACKR